MGPVELSVVVPAFNEASRIQSSIEDLLKFLPRFTSQFEILIVDDGSQDDTSAIVERVSAIHRAVLLHQIPHRGKGAAVRAGMLRARGGRRFMCDADLSMHPSQIAGFMAVVPSECDIAIATREAVGAERLDEPTYRHAMGRVFNRIVRATLVSDIHDTQCGFKMFSSSAAELLFSRGRIDGWAFDVEALYIARLHNLRVHEVPISWRHEQLSRISAVRDTFLMLRELGTIRRNAQAGLYD